MIVTVVCLVVIGVCVIDWWLAREERSYHKGRRQAMADAYECLARYEHEKEQQQ